jgi:hypothetical protein
VTQLGESELFTISFACPCPATANKVVDAVVGSYLRQRNESQERRVADRLETAKRNLEAQSLEVTVLRMRVQELAMQVTGKNPFVPGPDSASAEATRRSEYERQLVRNEVEELLVHAKLLSITEQSKQDVEPSEAAVAKSLAENPEIQLVVADIAQRKLKLLQLDLGPAKGRDESAACQEASKAIAKEEQLLESRKSALRPQIKEQVKAQTRLARDENLKKDLQTLRAELASRKDVSTLLLAKLRAEQEPSPQDLRKSVELLSRQKELERREKKLDLLADRLTRLEAEANAPAGVTRFADASLPTTPVCDFPFLQVGAASVLGFVLPFAAYGLYGIVVLRPRLRRLRSEHRAGT